MTDGPTVAMELTVLGAGPAYTDRPGALGSAYLLRAAGCTIALDLGQGVFPALAGEIEPSTLRAVVLSHLHPDHWIDLIPLRHYLCYEFDPSRRVEVHAPGPLADRPGPLADRLDALHDEPGFTSAALDVVALLERFELGPFSLETVPVTHTPESRAIRIALDGADHGFVYSGDCGRAMDLAPLVRPGDTLLVEVSFGPGPVPVDALHLDGPSIGELARETRPGRILLTHLQMGYDPARTIETVRGHYDGPVSFVEPGDRLLV